MEVSDTSAGLDLVSAPPAIEPVALPRSELASAEARLKELLDLDDFTGALETAEHLLAIEPNHELALGARKRCRDTLQRMYESKIGDLTAVPHVMVPPEQVIWLDLDHRSGFILAQVDDMSTFEELIELTGMDRLESLRLISMLVQKGVIGPP